MPFRRTPRRAGALTLAAVAALAVTGCSSSAKRANPPATTPGSSANSTGVASQAATTKVPLVVYSAQGYDSAVTKAFQAATGIPVKLDDDSTGPLLTKVAAEANNPQWDVLWVDGDTAFAALDKQGQLLDYAPPSPLTPAGQALLPQDHSYIPVSTTVMAAVIYNAAKASAVPSSYQDLLSPQFKGKVGMNDPSQSGPTYPFIAGLMNQLGGQSGGVAAGEAYFEKLKANGLHVFPTNGDTLHALETGQIDYGLIQSSAATGEVAKAKKSAGFDPKIVYLPEPTLLPGVIGIDKHVSPAAQAEAEQFVKFVLSAQGQQVMQQGDPTGDGLFWPIVPGVNPLPALPALPSNFQRIDPYFWGPLEGQVNSWFDTNIK
ncbi:MAG TPA: extracellular solute-binding protein [Acidimicrobiales bacterium]|nr:extracellular solute-binding protein [Acidimicrobiales bacterium]